MARVGLTANQSVYVVLTIYVLALTILFIGLAARWMAILAWYLHFLLMHAGGGLLYGMDYFTHIGLFYCIIMPTGDAASLPVFLQWRISSPSIAAGLTRKMLQIQMCIVYFSSGLEKACGAQWWNGEAIWRSVIIPTFKQFDFFWVAYVPWMAVLAGWGVMITECGYAVMMWSRHSRRVWFAMTCGLHLGIGLFMGMPMFALIMILLNCAAFGYEVWNDWVLFLKVRASDKTGLKPLCVRPTANGAIYRRGHQAPNG